eukprot:COSAG06_NODE_4487_length_4209_cov_18.427494_1_plen_216_part_10
MPAYIPPGGGKSIGLPSTWTSSPTHRGQNVVHAEADWRMRLDKEETVAKMMDPAGPFAEGAQIVIPQYADDSQIRDPWGWGSGLARQGHILNPMTAYRASTQCGLPAAVVARHEEELRTVSSRRSFAQTSLSEADLRRPRTAESLARDGPRDLVARSYDYLPPAPALRPSAMMQGLPTKHSARCLWLQMGYGPWTVVGQQYGGHVDVLYGRLTVCA